MTSPTAPHKIFVSIVVGRGFCSTARIYGPYVRVSKMHPYIRAANTASIYGPYLRVVRIGLKTLLSQNPPALNCDCRLTQVDPYDGRQLAAVCCTGCVP